LYPLPEFPQNARLFFLKAITAATFLHRASARPFFKQSPFNSHAVFLKGAFIKLHADKRLSTTGEKALSYEDISAEGHESSTRTRRVQIFIEKHQIIYTTPLGSYLTLAIHFL
jgi:hypothetical protein